MKFMEQYSPAQLHWVLKEGYPEPETMAQLVFMDLVFRGVLDVSEGKGSTGRTYAYAGRGPNLDTAALAGFEVPFIRIFRKSDADRVLLRYYVKMLYRHYDRRTFMRAVLRDRRMKGLADYNLIKGYIYSGNCAAAKTRIETEAEYIRQLLQTAKDRQQTMVDITSRIHGNILLVNTILPGWLEDFKDTFRQYGNQEKGYYWDAVMGFEDSGSSGDWDSFSGMGGESGGGGASGDWGCSGDSGCSGCGGGGCS